MASIGKRRERDPAVAARLPPGQELTTKWPVLQYGSVPQVELATWDFHVTGLVERPVRFTWDEFIALPQTRRHNDIHCVTRWSKLDNEWEGVAVLELMKWVTLGPGARSVLVHAGDPLRGSGFTANVLLDDFLREENLFAHSHDGRRLEPEHGYPLRLVVPHLYFWKSVKWVRGLEFLAEDRPGFWERNGYHMRGDPWNEERYSPWW